MIDDPFRTFLRSRDWDIKLRRFVIPASTDYRMPSLRSWQQLRIHLTKRGVTDHALQAAEEVWNLYIEHRHVQATKEAA